VHSSQLGFGYGHEVRPPCSAALHRAAPRRSRRAAPRRTRKSSLALLDLAVAHRSSRLFAARAARDSIQWRIFILFEIWNASRSIQQFPCPGPMCRPQVQDQVPCPGPVSRYRAQVPCPGPGPTRSHVQDQVWVPCPVPGPMSRTRPRSRPGSTPIPSQSSGRI